MKKRLVVPLLGLAVCSAFLLPAFAKQKDATEPPIVQQRDLLGSVKATGEFGDLHRKLDEAYDKNDAAAVAALFTEDGLFVTPDGMLSGRQEIAARHAETFQRSPIIDFNCSRERRHLDAIDNAVWSAGQWASTSQSPTGPVFAWGCWTAIYVREGGAWKFVPHVDLKRASATGCGAVPDYYPEQPIISDLRDVRSSQSKSTVALC